MGLYQNMISANEVAEFYGFLPRYTESDINTAKLIEYIENHCTQREKDLIFVRMNIADYFIIIGNGKLGFKPTKPEKEKVKKFIEAQKRLGIDFTIQED